MGEHIRVVANNGDILIIDKFNLSKVSGSKIIVTSIRGLKCFYLKKTNIFLHRALFGSRAGIVPKFINGNILDYRQCNIYIRPTFNAELIERKGHLTVDDCPHGKCELLSIKKEVRPKECVWCAGYLYEEHYKKCLNFAVINSWFGWKRKMLS